MNQIKTLITNYWPAVLITVLVFAGILIRFITPQITPVTPPPTPATTSIGNVTAGRTTQQEILQTLGEPHTINETPLGTQYLYPSNQEFANDEVYLQNNLVTAYIRRTQPNREITLDTYTQQLGKEPTIFYGEQSSTGYNLYVFLDDGIAILTSQYDQVSLETWTFIPTTSSQFLATWGQGYTTTFRSERINTDPE